MKRAGILLVLSLVSGTALRLLNPPRPQQPVIAPAPPACGFDTVSWGIGYRDAAREIRAELASKDLGLEKALDFIEAAGEAVAGER